MSHAHVHVSCTCPRLMALLMLRTSGERAFSRGTGNARLLVSRDASPLESVLLVFPVVGPGTRPPAAGPGNMLASLC